MEKTFINNKYPAIFGIKNTPANLANIFLDLLTTNGIQNINKAGFKFLKHTFDCDYCGYKYHTVYQLDLKSYQSFICGISFHRNADLSFFF